MPKTRKISVTVDVDVLQAVERRLRSSGQPLSSYVSEALAEHVRREALRDVIDVFEREHGALTEQEVALAGRKIQRAKRRRAKGRRAA
jgi:hypothetical protein